MTDTPRLTIRRAAVLGAGVMGAQIAAHLANADVPVLLYDLAASDGPPDGIARAAIARLGTLDPAPFASPERAAHVEPASYAHDLARLADCDLVIEAIAEKLEWKTALYAQVAPHLRADAVFASNTSGLSIATLAAALPAGLRCKADLGSATAAPAPASTPSARPRTPAPRLAGPSTPSSSHAC